MVNVHQFEIVAWNHNPQLVNWVQILCNRIPEWCDRPHPFLNFAWLRTCILFVNFKIGPPPSPYDGLIIIQNVHGAGTSQSLWIFKWEFFYGVHIGKHIETMANHAMCKEKAGKFVSRACSCSQVASTVESTIHFILNSRICIELKIGLCSLDEKSSRITRVLM